MSKTSTTPSKRYLYMCWGCKYELWKYCWFGAVWQGSDVGVEGKIEAGCDLTTWPANCPSPSGVIGGVTHPLFMMAPYATF